MSAVGIQSAPATLIKRDSFLPPSVEKVLRAVRLDGFTGNVVLNIKGGVILGIRKEEVISVPPHEHR